MNSVVIVDLGMGNLRSVWNAVQHVERDIVVSVTDCPDTIRNADYLILPGQGAIGSWMDRLLKNDECYQAVCERLQSGPVLGICLGLQALYHTSEENGGVAGLGLLPGKVKHFSQQIDLKHNATKFKVPHMGWNQVSQTRQHPLWWKVADKERFYFVHSYYVNGEVNEQQMATCNYAVTFTAAAARDNIFATQFHPEKSQHAGLQILKNFLNWNGTF